MAVTMKILPADMAKSIMDIRKYSTQKHNECLNELARSAYEIDTKQKDKLRIFSSGRKKNYSAIMAQNRVVVNMSGQVVTVSNDHKAAVFFEEGTRPHVITIKNKMVLATLSEYTGSNYNISIDKKGNSWQVFGKKVNHPGTKAMPFFFPPVAIVGKKMIENIKRILANAK